VGLDVHARSVRLAALRADDLLEERTLPYDHATIGHPAQQAAVRQRMIARGSHALL
jgi:hypothetical protein